MVRGAGPGRGRRWELHHNASRRAPPARDARRMPPVRGAIHIHTRRSDGTGTVDDVAAAAARAGLKFIILTDHGDGMREPDSPAYRHGVLCIDAVEINTASGHLVALGLPRVPYSLGGETRDVVEDVRRLGGMAIAGHPTSTRPQLRWTDWSVRLDGIEWANADSEWRDEPFHAFARTLLTYPFRRPETLATLLDRPDEALRRWDGLTQERPTVAVAGADAHARIALTSVGDAYENRVSLHLPGYEQIFRTFSIARTWSHADRGRRSRCAGRARRDQTRQRVLVDRCTRWTGGAVVHGIRRRRLGHDG